MNQRITAWLLILCIGFTALPARATTISRPAPMECDTGCVKTELPPKPIPSHDRQTVGQAKNRLERASSYKSSWQHLWQLCHWLSLMICVAVGLVWSKPVRAELFDNDEGFLPTGTSYADRVHQWDGARSQWLADIPGASADERPLWSPYHIKLMDPREYPRITSLDNDDPDSFWYTYRPNPFNLPIEDEWDWFNLINTQRPDFTDTPFSAGKGVTILETGYTFTRSRGNEQPTSTRTLPEAFLRHGLTDELEIQIKWNGYLGIDVKDQATGQSASTFGTYDTYVGFKYEFWQQNNWLPMTTADIGALLPTGTQGLSGNHFQPHVNVVTGWGLRRFIYLKHQFGYDYLSQPTFTVDTSGASPALVASRPIVDSFHSSVSLMYQATKRIGGFTEWFCMYGHNQPTTHFTDSGILYYLTPNVQLDGVIGTSIGSDDPAVLFAKAGFSTRW